MQHTPWVLEQASLFPWYTRYIPCKPASRLHFRCARNFVNPVRHGTSWNRHSRLVLLGRIRTQASGLPFPIRVIDMASRVTAVPLDWESNAVEWHVRSQAQGVFLNSLQSGNLGWGAIGVGRNPGAEPTTVGPGLPGKVAPGLNSQMFDHLRVDKTGSATP